MVVAAVLIIITLVFGVTLHCTFFIVFLVLAWAYISTLNALIYCFPPQFVEATNYKILSFLLITLPVKPKIVHKYVDNSACHHITSFSLIPNRVGIIFMRKP